MIIISCIDIFCLLILHFHICYVFHHLVELSDDIILLIASEFLNIAVGKQVSSGAHRSPKRTPRPMSMIVPGSKAQVPAINGTSGETPRKPEVKRPRPSKNEYYFMKLLISR